MKTLLAAFVLGTIVFGYYLLNKNEVTNADSKGNTLVAFGDSLVAGVGASKGHDFVTVLSESLGEEIINLGVSGNTTKQGLGRIKEVTQKNPKIVIVLLGGNDAIQKFPIEETFANLEKVILEIHAAGSAVVLVGVQGGLIGDRYKSEFKRLAKKYNTGYVPDILDGIFGRSKLMSDAIHPNNDGYVLIAQKIEPVLKQLLGKK